MFFSNRYYSDGKKVPPFWVFIVPIATFLAIGFPLITEYPIPISLLIISFIITILFVGLFMLYEGLKVHSYLKEHNFPLWKKTRVPSYRIRREASKEIISLVSQIPQLENRKKNTDKIAFIFLSAWTIVLVGVFAFILISKI